MWDESLFMTRDQMREYDRLAIEDVGIPGAVLMENAARGAAEIALDMIAVGQRADVIAGPGNNGGDGFAIARHLLNAGREVTIHLAAPASKTAGDARINLDVLRTMDPPVHEISDAAGARELEGRLAGSDLVVDALLGTGVSREVKGHLAGIIEAVNRALRPVLSVDVPSGLDADTGRPRGRAVRAVRTATFGHLKRGLVVHPGAEIAGEVRVIPIGVPWQVSERAGWDGRVLSEGFVRPLVPARPRDSHKGTFGHLLLVAGSLGKTGAAALAGEAAMRVGAGLVTLATTAGAQPILAGQCTEVMVEAIIDRPDAPLTEKQVTRVGEMIDGKRALAVGPGLSTAPGISALVIRALHTSRVPAVVDADGINILANDPSAAGRISSPVVITPHPGEMARLLGKAVPSIQSDRIDAAREAARRHQMIVALKGARTVVAAPDGRAFVNPTGNPGMASGGTGDVLTGVVGGLLAQEVPPLEAALLGVYLHGLAGDRAADRLGQPGLVATDLVYEIPGILRDWSVR